MKKSDIAMIILIATVSVMTAFAIGSRWAFLAPPKEGVEVRTIEALSSDVAEPDETVFNANAINPTVQTVIGHGAQ